MRNIRSTINCAGCGKQINAGEPYFMIGDRLLRMNYFRTDVDNKFCSKDCICNYLSVVEVWNKDELNESLLGVIAALYPSDAEVNDECGTRPHGTTI